MDAERLERAARALLEVLRPDYDGGDDDLDEAMDALRAALDAAPEPAQAGEAVYPCRRCGTLRTKAEGGTTFTICDECWDASKPSRPGGAAPPAPDAAQLERVAMLALQYQEEAPWLTEKEVVARAIAAAKGGA